MPVKDVRATVKHVREALKAVRVTADVVEMTHEDVWLWTAPAKRSDDGARGRTRPA